MIKKITSVLLIVVLVLCFAACGSRVSPTETVDSYFSALKAQEFETAMTYYAGGEDDVNYFESDDSLDVKDESEDIFTEKMLSFEYTLSNEVINGEKATVDCHIKTYSFGEILAETFEEYLTQAFALAFSDASDEEMDNLTDEIFIEKMESAELNYEADFQIALSLVDGKWIIDPFDEEGKVLDGLFGGIYSVASAFDELEEE